MARLHLPALLLRLRLRHPLPLRVPRRLRPLLLPRVLPLLRPLRPQRVPPPLLLQPSRPQPPR